MWPLSLQTYLNDDPNDPMKKVQGALPTLAPREEVGPQPEAKPAAQPAASGYYDNPGAMMPPRPGMPVMMPPVGSGKAPVIGHPPTSMPSGEPRHFGVPIDEIQRSGGGFGRLASGSTYGYRHGESPETARMNALGATGGVGDQAEALKLFRQMQGGPSFGPDTDPAAARAAFNDETMKAFLGLARQATDQGKAGVEEYLGLGRIGLEKDRMAGERDAAAARTAVDERTAALAERKHEHDTNKDVQLSKTIDSIVAAAMASGQNPAAAVRTFMKARTQAIGPQGTEPTPDAVARDLDDPDREFRDKEGFGQEFYDQWNAATAARTKEGAAKEQIYTPTLLSQMRTALGEDAFRAKLPLIRRFIETRQGYGPRAFRDALHPGMLRDVSRGLSGLTVGRTAEDEAVRSIRSYLGLDRGVMDKTIPQLIMGGGPSGPVPAQKAMGDEAYRKFIGGL